MVKDLSIFLFALIGIIIGGLLAGALIGAINGIAMRTQMEGVVYSIVAFFIGTVLNRREIKKSGGKSKYERATLEKRILFVFLAGRFSILRRNLVFQRSLTIQLIPIILSVYLAPNQVLQALIGTIYIIFHVVLFFKLVILNDKYD